MANHAVYSLIMVLIGISTMARADATCSSTGPVCTCKIGQEDVDMTPSSESHEALAGAVGALSSVVVMGGGVATYFLVKKICLKPKLPRSPRSSSTLSSESFLSRKNRTSPPPPYTGSNPQVNIYRAGLNDDVNHHVTSRATRFSD